MVLRNCANLSSEWAFNINYIRKGWDLGLWYLSDGDESPTTFSQETWEDAPGEMVYIPGGEFITGSNDQGLRVYYDIFGEKAKYQRPIEGVRKVHVKGFYINIYEVNNAQYKKFIKATGHSSPSHWENGTYPEGEDNYPVYNVSWYDANKYAIWTGKRLPTEQEWEKAARGIDGRHYPWGNESPSLGVNLWPGRGKRGLPQPVGSNKNDRSPYGVYDMAGNLMEWTGTEYQYDNLVRKSRNVETISWGTEVVVKGSAWSSDLKDTHLARKVFCLPSARVNGVGFRCVK